MLWKEAGHDRPLHIVNAVLTACSMSLSAYFGYVIGEGVFPLNIVLASLCAAVAFGVSMMFERGAVFDAMGLRRRAVNCWIVGLLFAGANAMFDYSSAAALRDAVQTAANNINNVADTRKSEVKRIEERIGEIKRQNAWATVFEAPDAYQAEIDNLQGDFLFKRSKQCGDTSLPDSRAHCAKIASAKAHKAMAEQRQGLAKEMAALDVELVKAKNTSADTKTHANPAVAQVRAISAWFTGDRQLNESTSFWGGNSIMLLMTVLVNAGLIYLGNEIGHARAGKMGVGPEAEPVNFTAHRLPGPAEAKEPIPLRAVDSNLVVINGAEQPNTTANDQLRAQAFQILAEVKRRMDQSPFAQQEGKA